MLCRKRDRRPRPKAVRAVDDVAGIGTGGLVLDSASVDAQAPSNYPNKIRGKDSR